MITYRKKCKRVVLENGTEINDDSGIEMNVFSCAVP